MAKAKLYYILQKKKQQGPFTLRQIRSMWSNGVIASNAFYWVEGKDEWENILEIQSLLEPKKKSRTPAPTTPSPPIGGYDYNQQLEVLKLQSRMKSKVIAAFLALFLPFVGCFYASAGVALVYGGLALLSMMVSIAAFDPHVDAGLYAALWPFFLLYIASIFSSIRSVGKYNEMLLGISYSNLSFKVKVNDSYVWSLAFAPVAGVIFTNSLALHFPSLASTAWIVVPMLNVGLSYIDEYSLKRSGYDTSQFGGGLAWLVPIYLYKRFVYFNHSGGYFICWMISITISFIIVWGEN